MVAAKRSGKDRSRRKKKLESFSRFVTTSLVLYVHFAKLSDPTVDWCLEENGEQFQLYP